MSAKFVTRKGCDGLFGSGVHGGISAYGATPARAQTSRIEAASFSNHAASQT